MEEIVREEIVRELEGVRRTTILKYTIDSSLDTTLDLPFLCIPFLNGIVFYNLKEKEKAICNLEEFKFLLEDRKIISRDFKETVSSTRREDKIKIYNFKREFDFKYIDWEDKKWEVKLLRYFYVMGSERIVECVEGGSSKNSSMGENRGKEGNRGKNGKGLKVYRIERGGRQSLPTVSYPPPTLSYPSFQFSLNRNELLRRRINPKYSLEDFGDVLVERLKKLEEMVETQRIEKDLGETQRRGKDLGDLRREDEERDERHVHRGNTKNVG